MSNFPDYIDIATVAAMEPAGLVILCDCLDDRRCSSKDTGGAMCVVRSIANKASKI